MKQTRRWFLTAGAIVGSVSSLVAPTSAASQSNAEESITSVSEQEDGGNRLSIDTINANEIDGIADHVVTTQDQLHGLPDNLADGDTVIVGDVTHSQVIEIDGVDNVTIRGMGETSSTITTADGANCGLFRIGHNSSVGSITIKGLTLDGNNENQPGAAVTANPIWTQDVDHLKCENIFFKDSIVSRGSGGEGENTSCARVFHPTRKAEFVNCDVDAEVVRGIESSCEELHVTGREFKNTFERCISLDALVKTQRLTQRAYIDDVTVTKGSTGGQAGACVGGAGLLMQDVGDANVSPTGSPIEEWIIENSHLGEEGATGKRTGITVREFSSNDTLFKFRNNTIGEQDQQGIVCKHTDFAQSQTEDATIISESNRAVMNPGGASAYAYGNAQTVDSRGDTAIGKGINIGRSSDVSVRSFSISDVSTNNSLSTDSTADSITICNGTIRNSSNTAIKVLSDFGIVNSVRFVGQSDNSDCLRIDGDYVEIRNCSFRGGTDNPARHAIFAVDVEGLFVVGCRSQEGITGDLLRLHRGSTAELTAANSPTLS